MNTKRFPKVEGVDLVFLPVFHFSKFISEVFTCFIYF